MDLNEVVAHTSDVVSVLWHSNKLAPEAKLHLIHEATGIYTSLVRKVNTVHYQLDKIRDKAEDIA